MRTPLAWTFAGATLVFAISDVAVTAAYRPLLSQAAVVEHGFPFVILAALGSAVLGAVIVSRDERHPVGLLLNLIGMTSAFSLATEAYSIWVVSEGGPGSRALGGYAGWLSSLVAGQLAIGGLALMFLLAPNGRLLSPRWRYAVGAIVVGELLCAAALLTLDPAGFDLQSADVGAVRGRLFTLGFMLIAVGLLSAVVSMLLRLRRSRGETRQQVRLIALGVVLVALGVACLFVVQAINGGRQTWEAQLPLFISYLLLPILFAVAVLRYRLYDIDLILNWTVVLAFGTAFAGLGYVTLVVLVGRLVGTRTSGFLWSLLATALVALAFQPLRRAVVRAANRLAYGQRAQPYEALSDFSRRLAETPSPARLLPAIAEAAGRAVAARSATAVMYDGTPDGHGTVSATWGEGSSEPASSHAVPVLNDGQDLGVIEVGLTRGRPWRASDERLLAALADQASVAFRNTAMESRLAQHVADLDRTARELGRSRSRIIEAEDDARRALESAVTRDVLSHLEGLPQQVRLARDAVTQGRPGNGLEELVASTTSALESLRELTRGVFPTQLARAGLGPALTSLLARNGAAALLTVDPAVADRRFPARVEGAVYFCCVQALSSDLTSVSLSVAGDDLLLEVGLRPGRGVELEPVRDRVEAAGGSLDATAETLRCTFPPPDT